MCCSLLSSVLLQDEIIHKLHRHLVALEEQRSREKQEEKDQRGGPEKDGQELRMAEGAERDSSTATAPRVTSSCSAPPPPCKKVEEDQKKERKEAPDQAHAQTEEKRVQTKQEREEDQQGGRGKREEVEEERASRGEEERRREGEGGSFSLSASSSLGGGKEAQKGKRNEEGEIPQKGGPRACSSSASGVEPVEGREEDFLKEREREEKKEGLARAGDHAGAVSRGAPTSLSGKDGKSVRHNEGGSEGKVSSVANPTPSEEGGGGRGGGKGEHGQVGGESLVSSASDGSVGTSRRPSVSLGGDSTASSIDILDAGGAGAGGGGGGAEEEELWQAAKLKIENEVRERLPVYPQLTGLSESGLEEGGSWVAGVWHRSAPREAIQKDGVGCPNRLTAEREELRRTFCLQRSPVSQSIDS